MSEFSTSGETGFHFFFPIATIWLKRWRDVYDAVWYVGGILILSDLKNEMKPEFFFSLSLFLSRCLAISDAFH